MEPLALPISGPSVAAFGGGPDGEAWNGRRDTEASAMDLLTTCSGAKSAGSGRKEDERAHGAMHVGRTGGAAPPWHQVMGLAAGFLLGMAVNFMSLVGPLPGPEASTRRGRGRRCGLIRPDGCGRRGVRAC